MTPLPVCRQCGKKSDNPICMRCERGDAPNEGVPASPSGSRALHGAADASPPEASIPNAGDILEGAWDALETVLARNGVSSTYGTLILMGDIWDLFEQIAASAIEARSDATPKSGAAEGESAGPKDDAQ